ncbi:carboxylating nicotinate-nucleotide diphosphorylase [Methanolobus sp. ZRKC3]|uniref:carboxylating nicotinate-nucleotide diphosphorylase n=1 Tax=Methanolobus sp. ZRKC3 TaxID=3125786 RepID=UPI003251141F
MFIGDIERFLKEDLGYNDISCHLVPDRETDAIIFAKADCVVAGIGIARSFFDYLGINATTEYEDGSAIGKGDVIFNLRGSSVSILRAERLVLNFLGHLSGIATLTRKCVDMVGKHSNARVACTRKTTPGIREYEKMAVVAGGGDSHRFNLSDSIMIKDNHVKMMGVEAAIRSAKEKASFTQKIEVEVESVENALLAAKCGADIIMLDNMSPDTIIETVSSLKGASIPEHILVEVSGGIDSDNLEEYAKTGVDVISMGSLIHKSSWVDVSLEFLE